MMITQRVPLSLDNVTKCMCPQCPVQSGSRCSSNKMMNIKAALAKNPLQKEDIPGVYCSTGVPACTDLNPKKACICGSCDVFKNYKLNNSLPNEYYCRDGMSR